MALGSNAPRCAAGDCPEQLRFDFHQLHHERLLMVSRVLVVNPERWVSDAARCSASQGKEEPRVDERSGELHQLHREGLLMVSDGLDRGPTAMGERYRTQRRCAEQCAAKRGKA